MPELLFSITALLFWLLSFGFNVAAVLVGLWIWNRWQASTVHDPRLS